MRTPLIAANWKMHKTVHETVAFVRELGALIRDLEGVEVVVAPPFTAIAAAAETARNLPVVVAGQDVYFERQGAFTGEVSAEMLKDAGAGFAIIGHSERRSLFGETDAWVNRKLRAVLEAGLSAIVCVGETLEERERGETLAVLDRQLEAAIEDVPSEAVAGIVVAYEPVWAIGTGKTATAAEAEEAHRHLRNRLLGWRGEATADQCRILYGGSVKPDNSAELMACPNVDGALVGGASLDVKTFVEIVKKAV